MKWLHLEVWFVEMQLDNPLIKLIFTHQIQEFQRQMVKVGNSSDLVIH